jgi:hypothetical protein
MTDSTTLPVAFDAPDDELRHPPTPVMRAYETGLFNVSTPVLVTALEYDVMKLWINPIGSRLLRQTPHV